MVSGALIFVTTGAASEITIFLFTAAMLIANGEAAVTALVVVIQYRLEHRSDHFR